jgi:phosphatidylserine decarboxylase
VQGEGIEVTFKQIAGLLARRIVFNFHEGERVERGERVGLIKFGSRVDVLLPAEAALRVKVGQRVKGGSSVLAEMAEPEMAFAAPAVKRAMSANVQPDEVDEEAL